MEKYVVVGAGVIGLTCALVLSQKGYQVSIIASHFPIDNNLPSSYTSSKAGAHFRPFPSKTKSDQREARYTRETFKYFKTLAKEYPDSSIRFVKGEDWIENPSQAYLKLEYTKDLNDFKLVNRHNVDFACSYETWVLNAPMYIQFLYQQLVKYNVKFIRQHLSSLQQVYTIFPGSINIINATAFGLQLKGGYDPSTYPIRGQILVLDIPTSSPYTDKTITHQSKNGDWTYLINRPCNGGCILGGTKQLNNLNSNPSQIDITDIKTRAKRLFPDLFTNDLNVITESVGFRPARKGGSRVELEFVQDNAGRLVHCYGIGGMGFEASYGMALHAVSLLEMNKTAKI